MEIRARQAADDIQLNNIRSKYKYGLGAKGNIKKRYGFNFQDGFKGRGENTFFDGEVQHDILGSNREMSGLGDSQQSRGVHRTTGDTQTGTRGTVEETLNPKATEVKAPSDFDNIYEGIKEYKE